MRITHQQLRHIIREELLREKRYLKRIDSVADVQTALNVALADEPGFTPLEVDKQWGPITDAAWFMFVDKFYEPAVGEPTKDDVKNKWETAGVKLEFDDDNDGISNAADAADFITANTPLEKMGQQQGEPDPADTNQDGTVSNDEMLATYGAPEVRGTKTVGLHPWRSYEEPDSLPRSLTLDDADNWSYEILYSGADFDETDDDKSTIKSKVDNGFYVIIDTESQTESKYELNTWFDTTAEELRGTLRDHLTNIMFLYEASDGQKPSLMIWADDGQIPQDLKNLGTTGFTIKTLRDFNRVFGAPGSVKESFTLRWAKLAGLIRG